MFKGLLLEKRNSARERAYFVFRTSNSSIMP
jgi:hypothetical protein